LMGKKKQMMGIDGKMMMILVWMWSDDVMIMHLCYLLGWEGSYQVDDTCDRDQCCCLAGIVEIHPELGGLLH
jgi:hypothetical protein